MSQGACSVTDFSISYLSDGIQNSTLDDDVQILGSPYHATRSTLVDRYTESITDFLDSEARYSCGNYVLFDTTDDHIIAITSPGFSGGYFVDKRDELHLTSTLRQALEAVGPHDIEINYDRLVNHISQDLKVRLPFSTVFEDVYRLPPGTYLRGNGDGYELESNLVSSVTPPSFAEASTEISEALRGENVVVCLSGGADSAALAGILAQNDVEFDTVVFDWGPGDADAIERGPIIAEKLGVDYDIVEIQRPLTGGTAPYVEQCLREDIVKPYVPTMQVRDRFAEDAMFTYGFYPDVLCWPKMRDQHSYQSLGAESLKRLIGQLLRFLPNIQYTHHVIEEKGIRNLYLTLCSALMQAMNPVLSHALGKMFPEQNYNLGYFRTDPRFSISASTEDVFRGTISSGRANVLAEQPQFDRLSRDTESTVLSGYDDQFIDNEISIFDSMRGVEPDIQVLKEFAYFINMQNTQKQLSTFATPGGQEVGIPMDWGPSIAYFFENRNGLERAMYPKPEVYDVVESFTGEPYHELMSNVTPRGADWDEPKGEPLVRENSDLLSPSNSRVLAKLDRKRREQLLPVYEDRHSLAVSNEYWSPHESQRVVRLLNLELLLDEVMAKEAT